jgi:hypothetical protein
MQETDGAPETSDLASATIKLNTRAVNAVSRAVGEVRRSLGVRAAAEVLPEIFAKAGIQVKAAEAHPG